MSVSKSVPRLPSPPIKEEASMMKQGIVTILRSDPENSKSDAAANSIRRTLSADMSSKKWLGQNGFHFAPMKAIDHHNPDSSSSSEGEEDDQNRPGHDDIWRSIQQEKEKKAFQKPNIWGSLVLTEKNDNNSKSDLPPPYVHPLVRRSASMLSEKSLKICTESLGSETGSDCFSSYPVSDEGKEERYRAFVQEEFAKETSPLKDLEVNKYTFSVVRPFPPPIPSITGGDGASLHMHSKRENGRLVLEAVSIPSRNYFHAQRQDGRLVLTLDNSPNEAEENKGEVFDNMEEIDKICCDDGGYYDEEEEEENIESKSIAEEMEFVKSTRSRMVSVHKTGLVMKKLVSQGYQNPTWSKKVVVEDEELAVPQSLPPVASLIPSPTPKAAASLNAYDYFWRKNTVIGPIMAAPQCTPIKNNYNGKINGGNQELVIMKEKKEEHFAPYSRACKDGRRRSLLIWEPYCISTS